MSRHIVALLPMKANSERVKRKNFRVFNGKPLFAWVLESLLSVEAINRVIINTDARSVLEEYGLTDRNRVLIRDRRADLCGDMVSMNSILADDIEHVPANIYLMTHTTNPLLSETTINAALTAFESTDEDIDSLFTVNRHQARFYREDGSPINHDPTNLVRTQDLEPWYEENSNLYIFTRNSFEHSKSRIGKKPIMYETPYLESFDIDEPDDWALCEILSKHLISMSN